MSTIALRAVNLRHDLSVPRWVCGLLGEAAFTQRHEDMRVAASERYTCISARIVGARGLEREALSERVYRMYSEIADELSRHAASHPVRFWNHICGIHDEMGGGMDRYMAFNVGRYRAFEQWFGGANNFATQMATASGIGCDGRDLAIHVLAADRTGIAVSNPRQVEAFAYSQRYGPKPPCFARATILPMLEEHPLVLIGGTASICGEQSTHIGDLHGQVQETFANLAALVKHAGELARRPASLVNIHELRIYVVDEEDAETIVAATRQAIPSAREVQLMRADICRRELLVEIEGVARL